MFGACKNYHLFPPENPDDEPTCPADIRIQVEPANAGLRVDETVQATYRVFTCGGTIEETISPVWVSADPATAMVSDTGLITALQSGNTTITVSEDMYATEATINVGVLVVDPGSPYSAEK